MEHYHSKIIKKKKSYLIERILRLEQGNNKIRHKRKQTTTLNFKYKRNNSCTQKLNLMQFSLLLFPHLS